MVMTGRSFRQHRFGTRLGPAVYCYAADASIADAGANKTTTTARPTAKYISDIRIVDATVGSSIPPLARRGRFASCLFSEGFNSYEIDYLALSGCKAIWLTPLNTLRRLMAERLGSFHARVETMAGRSRGWTRQPRTLSPKNVAVRFTLK